MQNAKNKRMEGYQTPVLREKLGARYAARLSSCSEALAVGAYREAGQFAQCEKWHTPVTQLIGDPQNDHYVTVSVNRCCWLTPGLADRMAQKVDESETEKRRAGQRSNTTGSRNNTVYRCEGN